MGRAYRVKIIKHLQAEKSSYFPILNFKDYVPVSYRSWNYQQLPVGRKRTIIKKQLSWLFQLGRVPVPEVKSLDVGGERREYSGRMGRQPKAATQHPHSTCYVAHAAQNNTLENKLTKIICNSILKWDLITGS